MSAQDRGGEGVWLVAFLVLLATVGKPAVEVAKHPPSRTRPHTRVHVNPPPAPAPSPAAKGGIPSNYLTLYRLGAKQCPGLPWGVLAGIGKVETNHGRSTLPGVRTGVNAFGCCAGPMQFNIRNGPPSTWDAYGRGGNPYDPRDAIPAAARLLCANGAPRDLHRAVFAYNHAEWYVAQVLSLARTYQSGRG